MTILSTTWLLICDRQHAHLLRAERYPGHVIRMTETDSMEDTDEQHEHGRPQALGSMRLGAYASSGHEIEQQEQRFAHDIIHWSRDMIARHAIDRLRIFAPPRLLSVLRSFWPHHLIEDTDLIEGEFVNMPLNELHQNPTIRAAVFSRHLTHR